MTLYRIEMRYLKDAPDAWEDVGDKPTTKEQAEAWLKDYLSVVLVRFYEYRVVAVDA